MKSLIAACAIFALVIAALALNGTHLQNTTEALTDAVHKLPQNTDGDPADYEIAMQSAHIIWKENRERIAVTVPRRTTEPFERALLSIEAGWKTKDDTLYRQSVAEALFALRHIREAEGFSLAVIL